MQSTFPNLVIAAPCFIDHRRLCGTWNMQRVEYDFLDSQERVKRKQREAVYGCGLWS